MVSQLRRPRNLSISISGWPYAPGDNGGGAPTFSYDQELRARALDLMPSYQDDMAPLQYLAARTPDLSTIVNAKQVYACFRTSATYSADTLVHCEDVLNVSDVGTLRFAPGLAGSAFVPVQLTNSLLGLYSATSSGTTKYYVVPDASLGSYWTNTKATFAYPTADFMDTLRGITAGLGLEIVPIGNLLMITTPTKLVTPPTVSGFKMTATTPAVVASIGLQWYDCQAIIPPGSGPGPIPVIYNGSNSMITINAGEVQTISVTAVGVSGNMAALQPQCVSATPMIPYDGTSGSIYCVTGSDGYIVSPARWAANGGSITVKRGNGPFEYILTVTASKEAILSPYTISEGPDFPALYLVSQNDGVVFTPRSLVLNTGAVYAFANDVTVLPDPTIVDCPYVNTSDAAWAASYRMLRRTTGTQYTATAVLAVDTVIPQADGLPPYYQIQSVPVPQLCTARFYQDGHYWRPNQLTWVPDSRTVSVTLAEYTTAADFNLAYSGMTCAQFDTLVTSQTGLTAPQFADFDARPILNGVYQ
jgi:hypothetical protein